MNVSFPLCGASGVMIQGFEHGGMYSLYRTVAVYTEVVSNITWEKSEE